MRVSLSPCFILHTRPFRETSMIVEVFSRVYGRISLLARGVRGSKGCGKGLLRPFIPLLISWSGKTALMTLNQVELAGRPLYPTRRALCNGLYVNELLMRTLPRCDAYPGLFAYYHDSLTLLFDPGQTDRCVCLLEKELLRALGYGLLLTETSDGHPILPHGYYRFIPNQGFKRQYRLHADQVVDTFSGESLVAMHHGKFNDGASIGVARRLNRLALAMLLDVKTLKSVQFFAELYP